MEDATSERMTGPTRSGTLSEVADGEDMLSGEKDGGGR